MDDSTMMERLLAAALYRQDCAEPTELGEYQLNILDRQRRLEIERHLEICPHCSAELAQLRHFLLEVAPDLRQGVYRPLKLLIGRLISQSGSSEQMRPALAMRGEAQEPLIYEAGDARIMLELLHTTQPTPSSPSPVQLTLTGMVLGMDPAALQAHLHRDGVNLQPVAIDEFGSFTITGLSPGQYELTVSNDELEIRIPAIAV
jgi:hypothetical protein